MSLPYFGESDLLPAGTYNNQYQEIDSKIEEIHTVIVHKFSIGDVDDPDLYAAEPLLAWEKSPAGQWIMERAIESPIWHRQLNPVLYSHSYSITAKLRGKDYTYWCLKWKDQVDKPIQR